VEETLVQFFLRYVDLSTGMLEKKGSDAFESSVFEGLNDLTNDVGVVKEHMMSPSGPFPLPISCHILTLMLDAALQSLQAAPISEFLVAHGSFAEKFAANLILDLCNVTEGLLVQSVEHRSCAIGFSSQLFSKHLFPISLLKSQFMGRHVYFPGKSLQLFVST
jgi:tRNA guanosine-2'-O-methyltransferase